MFCGNREVLTEGVFLKLCGRKSLLIVDVEPEEEAPVKDDTGLLGVGTRRAIVKLLIVGEGLCASDLKRIKLKVYFHRD